MAIHEIGFHNDQSYFSMDFIEGQTLSEAVKADRPNPVRAASYLQKIARAMAYAHSQGILHRDLKPQNILLDAFDQPKITDFGLSKRVSDPSDLTRSGGVLGTPSYMSPEQARGRNEVVDARSDVYALGAILYEMLTGAPPFKGETATDTILKVINESPAAPSIINPGVHRDLETICLKCLEKAPENRYASAQEVADELGRFIDHLPIVARPANAWRKVSSWAQRRPWVLVALSSLVILALLGVTYGFWQQIKYLQWKNDPEAARLGGFRIPQESDLFWTPIEGGPPWFILTIPLLLFGFYARNLSRKHREGFHVSNGSLALLAAFGLLLAGIGLGAEFALVRLKVWLPSFPLPALLGLSIGLPFVFMWLGGVWVWQAIEIRMRPWAGPAQNAENEWLPRQASHYNSGIFFGVNLLGIFISIIFAKLTTSWWRQDFRPDGMFNLAEDRFFQISFVFISYGISLALWTFGKRQANREPTPVLIFCGVVFAGMALVWAQIPSRIFLSCAALSGAIGGILLLKLVKITPGPRQKLPPLRWSDIFEVTGSGIKAPLLLALGLFAALNAGMIFFFPDLHAPFLIFVAMGLVTPCLALGARNKSPKIREFFLTLLLGTVSLVPAAVILALVFGSPSFAMIGMLGSFLIGAGIGQFFVKTAGISAARP